MSSKDSEKVGDPGPSRPELVVGLVGAAGTDLTVVQNKIVACLGAYGYEAADLPRISKLMHGLAGGSVLAQDRPEDQRMEIHMNAGDLMRKQAGRNDAAAALAIAAIDDMRPIEGIPSEGTVYVLNSLKHPQEVETLRSVYRNRFILVAAHSPTETRRRQLCKLIAKSHGEPHKEDDYLEITDLLMKRDEEDEEKPFGQHVRDAFSLADLFVSAKDPDLSAGIERYFKLFFSYPFETPTKDEFGMFQAHAAALRSADLSRQVGAALAVENGEVIALGCNDVPKALGGQYWAGDDPDHRDFEWGYDSNAKSRDEALETAFEKLEAAGQLGSEATQETFTAALKGTRLSNITEFGRPVHAEMAAILDAGRRGVSVQDTILYTTTFPCHNCARHVIAAGIRSVIYREPYEKSLASKLHPDAMVVDPEDSPDDKVVFRRFEGVGPARFQDLFAKVQRKDSSGVAIDWDQATAEPRLVTTGAAAYMTNEADLLAETSDVLARVTLDELEAE